MHSLRATQPAEILLVDSNRLGLAARKSVLEEMGHHVTTASNGAEALERFRSAGFDLVITGYRMPGLDGVELIRQIRAIRPSVPVVLISAYPEVMCLTEASTGADAVIAKSAQEVSHLTRAVARLLRRRGARKPVASVPAHAKARHSSA